MVFDYYLFFSQFLSFFKILALVNYLAKLTYNDLKRIYFFFSFIQTTGFYYISIYHIGLYIIK